MAGKLTPRQETREFPEESGWLQRNDLQILLELPNNKQQQHNQAYCLITCSKSYALISLAYAQGPRQLFVPPRRRKKVSNMKDNDRKGKGKKKKKKKRTKMKERQRKEQKFFVFF